LSQGTGETIEQQALSMCYNLSFNINCDNENSFNICKNSS